MTLVLGFTPDADFIDRQLDLETRLRAEAGHDPDPSDCCGNCGDPRSWGTGHCVGDATRPHVYTAEQSSTAAYVATQTAS